MVLTLRTYRFNRLGCVGGKTISIKHKPKIVNDTSSGAPDLCPTRCDRVDSESRDETFYPYCYCRYKVFQRISNLHFMWLVSLQPRGCGIHHTFGSGRRIQEEGAEVSRRSRGRHISLNDGCPYNRRYKVRVPPHTSPGLTESAPMEVGPPVSRSVVVTVYLQQTGCSLHHTLGPSSTYPDVLSSVVFETHVSGRVHQRVGSLTRPDPGPTL